MKKPIILCIILALAFCLTGCLSFHSEKLRKVIDKDISSKNQTPEEDDYYSEIVLTDIFHGKTEDILELFSKETREELGDEKLTEMIRESSQAVQGELVKFTVEEQRTSGTRGGVEPNYYAYEICAYTDMDIYNISLIYCDGGVKNKETHDKKEGLEIITVRPVGAMYLPNGEIDTEHYPNPNLSRGMYAINKEPAKMTTYPDGNYTGYSVALLQMKTATDYELSANVEYIEELLSVLASQGMNGEVSEVDYIYEGHEKYSEEFVQGYNYHILSEDGSEFFVRFNPNAIKGYRVEKLEKRR